MSFLVLDCNDVCDRVAFDWGFPLSYHVLVAPGQSERGGSEFFDSMSELWSKGELATISALDYTSSYQKFVLIPKKISRKSGKKVEEEL